MDLKPGDLVSFQTAGGGGLFPATERDEAAKQRDYIWRTSYAADGR